MSRPKFCPKLIPGEERRVLRERILRFPSQENVKNETINEFEISENEALLGSYREHFLYQIGVTEKELKEAEEEMQQKMKNKGNRVNSIPVIEQKQKKKKYPGDDSFNTFRYNEIDGEDEVMRESDFSAVSLLQSINGDTRTCVDAYISNDKNIPRAVKEIIPGI